MATFQVGDKVRVKEFDCMAHVSEVGNKQDRVAVHFENNEGFWTYLGDEIDSNLELVERPMTPHTDATTLAGIRETRKEYEEYEKLYYSTPRIEYEARQSAEILYDDRAHLLAEQVPFLLDHVAALERQLADAQVRERAAVEALQAFVAGDSWMEHERVSSHNICHYCGERFSGWTTPDRHSEDCPVLAAQAVLAQATAQPADGQQAGGE